MTSGLFESLGWFIRGLVKAMLRAAWALTRPGLRVISVVALVAAVVALTSDFTRWQTGAGGPLFQSLTEILSEFAPATFEGAGQFIALKLHPLVWDPVLTGILNLPAWMVLFAVALATGFAARDRESVDIFVN